MCLMLDDDQTLQPVLIGEVHWNKELIFTVTYFNSTDSIWPGKYTKPLIIFHVRSMMAVYSF